MSAPGHTCQRHDRKLVRLAQRDGMRLGSSSFGRVLGRSLRVAFLHGDDLVSPPVEGLGAEQVADRPPVWALEPAADELGGALDKLEEISLADPVVEEISYR